ncbi:MAG: DUF2190 family protein [Synechococcaceae cyanobacterium SM1_2_3]|nr:DUF2190 family protein [Synechococcaceae cyanobacterium SM1_2_3]
MVAAGQNLCIALEAAADLSLHQFTVMRVVSTNAINIASHNAVTRAIGVLQDTPNAVGRMGRVAVAGETVVKAGAAFSAGVPLSHNSSGRAIAATSGLCIIGTSLEVAAADGDFVRMLLATTTALGQV